MERTNVEPRKRRDLDQAQICVDAYRYVKTQGNIGKNVSKTKEGETTRVVYDVDGWALLQVHKNSVFVVEKHGRSIFNKFDVSGVCTVEFVQIKGCDLLVYDWYSI